MALLDDILSFLDSQGVSGGATEWITKVSFLPNEPDKIISIYESPGSEPVTVTDPDDDESIVTYPNFQVRVRGDVQEYQEARAKMEEVFRTLHNASIAGYVYIKALQSGPLPLGNDGNDRPEMAMNFKVMEV